MNDHPPFHYLQPFFYAGLFDDPLLLIHIRPSGTSLLLDCGQMQHLAKRVLKSVSAAFVSHGHMDHFMGLDNLIRNVHVSAKTVEVYGPPGIAAKTCHKFAAYDWNLTEPSWCSFRVHEIHAGRIARFFLPGPEAFTCRNEGEFSRADKIIHENEYLRVEADLCDHKIPSLIYRVSEQPVFSVDEEKLEEAGLIKGEWVQLLKKRLHLHDDFAEPLMVLRRRGGLVKEEPVTDLRSLYRSICRNQAPAAIGYMTDIGFSENNVDRVLALLKGVSLLVCECSFLAEEREKARISHHLCTTDLNELIDTLRPRYVLPMHLSKSYAGRSYLLYEQLDFPPEVALLRLPDRVAPRPLLMEEAVGLLRPQRKRGADSNSRTGQKRY